MSVRGVRDLIVVLREDDEALRSDVERRSSAAMVLPRVPLALKEEPVLRRRDELLRRAMIAAVVGFGTSRRRDPRAVVEVVVPKSIERVAAFIAGTQELDVLRLVFAND